MLAVCYAPADLPIMLAMGLIRVITSVKKIVGFVSLLRLMNLLPSGHTLAGILYFDPKCEPLL